MLPKSPQKDRFSLSVGAHLLTDGGADGRRDSFCRVVRQKRAAPNDQLLLTRQTRNPPRAYNRVSGCLCHPVVFFFFPLRVQGI